MQWVRKQNINPQTIHFYRQALTVTLLGNLVLAFAKSIIAYFSGSVAIYADAANSISDLIYSIAMIWGLWKSLQPADRSHPQGHSRFEPMVGMLVTLSMTIAGFEAVKAAVTRFFEGGIAIDPGLPSLILIASAVIKLFMFLFIRNYAKLLKSPTLNAASKDNLSDVLTSAAAFIGVGLSSFAHPLFDPIAGFLVSLWIFKNAFEAGKENFAYLTGAGASPEDCDQFVKIASSIDGVNAIHHLMAEYVGPHLVLDMHINVDGTLTLNESHAIADKVIEALESEPSVDRAYVHVEPDGWI